MAPTEPQPSDSLPKSRRLGSIANLFSRTAYSNSVDGTVRTTDSTASDYNDIPRRTSEYEPPKLQPNVPVHNSQDAQIRNRVNVILNERALEHHARSSDYSSPHKSVHHAPRSTHPFLHFRRTWDMFMLAILVYVATVSVFVYSFLGVLGVRSVWFWIERLVDIAFIADVILSFFFPPYDKNGDLMDDIQPSQARKRYIRTWFVVDVVSAFPWDIVVLVVVGRQTDQHLLQLPRFLRVLRLLKLIRLFRALRLSTVFRFFEVKFRLKYGHVRLVSLYVTVILIAHWFACAFFYFGSLGLDAPWTAEDYVPADLYGKYITALYFSVYTITTIGYGDVTPENTLERTYTTIIMFLGAACFAYVISQVSNISGELNRPSERFRNTMDALTDLQQSRDLPQELVSQIRTYFHRANRKPQLDSERGLLRKMTKEHRLQVIKHMYGARLESSKLFHDISRSALDNVYDKVHEKVFLSGQFLYRQGDRPQNLFILVDGEVRIEEEGEAPVTKWKPGEMFGDDDLLFYQKRQGNAICTDFTTVICVPRKAVMEVLEDHETELKKLRDGEALKLWAGAIKNVKQQIQYVRFARTLRCNAEEYMRNKGMEIEMCSPDTSTRAILLALRGKDQAASVSTGENGAAQKTEAASSAEITQQDREQASVETLQAELDKKDKYIKQLEKLLELVERHSDEIRELRNVKS